jgi:hypothetical protein
VSVTIPELERGYKGFRVRAGESGNARENLLGCSGRLLVERDQGVAEEDEDAGR